MGRFLYYQRVDGIILRRFYEDDQQGIHRLIAAFTNGDDSEAVVRDLERQISEAPSVRTKIKGKILKSAINRFEEFNHVGASVEDDFAGLSPGSIGSARSDIARLCAIASLILDRQPELERKWDEQLRAAAAARRAEAKAKAKAKEEVRQEKIAEIKAALPAKRSHKRKPVAP